ncbi:LicD family protein [Weissella confusa]|uniref:LicD family protein n=1 Tax=Weissella confusa TaxID=1583 RepID=UPI00396F6162
MSNTKELTISEVQHVMWQMVTEAIEFMETNHLHYVLTGGSALGAVRHQGFIPWDDDVDIALPRDEYEWFIREFTSKAPTFKLRNLSTTSEWFYAYSRIVDTETQSEGRWAQMNTGVFIDIFPLDAVPQNGMMRRLVFSAMKGLDVLRNSTRRVAFRTDEKHKWVKQLLTGLTKRVGTATFATMQQQLALSVNRRYANKTNLLDLFVISGLNGARELMTVDAIRTADVATFNGLAVRVPQDVHNYLTELYGDDYMQLPVYAKRKTHATYKKRFNK